MDALPRRTPSQRRPRMPAFVPMRLLPALLAAVLLAAGCGEADTPAPSDATRSATPEPSPSPESGTQAQDGSTVRGTGYSFTVPAGWRDAKGEFEGSAVRIDTAYAAQTATDGFPTNVNVVRETLPNLEPRAFDEAVTAFQAQMAPRALDGTLTKIHKFELDGAPGRAWTFESKRKGNRIRVAQVVALKGRAFYTITFTAPAGEADRSEKQFEQIMETWRWSG
jgi:hypothetical protein